MRIFSSSFVSFAALSDVNRQATNSLPAKERERDEKYLRMRNVHLLSNSENYPSRSLFPPFTLIHDQNKRLRTTIHFASPYLPTKQPANITSSRRTPESYFSFLPSFPSPIPIRSTCDSVYQGGLLDVIGRIRVGSIE